MKIIIHHYKNKQKQQYNKSMILTKAEKNVTVEKFYE